MLKATALHSYASKEVLPPKARKFVREAYRSKRGVGALFREVVSFLRLSPRAVDGKFSFRSFFFNIFDTVRERDVQ